MPCCTKKNIPREAEPYLTEQDNDLVDYFPYVVESKQFTHPPRGWQDERIMYEKITELCT